MALLYRRPADGFARSRLRLQFLLYRERGGEPVGGRQIVQDPFSRGSAFVGGAQRERRFWIGSVQGYIAAHQLVEEAPAGCLGESLFTCPGAEKGGIARGVRQRLPDGQFTCGKHACGEASQAVGIALEPGNRFKVDSNFIIPRGRAIGVASKYFDIWFGTEVRLFHGATTAH